MCLESTFANRGRVVLAAICGLALAACGHLNGEPASTPSAASTSASAVAAAVPAASIASSVAHAASIKKVPDNMQPALSALAADTGDVQKRRCQAQQSDTTVKTCVYGDTSARRTLVILGDSHAGMWVPALDVVGKREHMRVIPLGKPGCPSPLLHFWDYAKRQSYKACDAWHTWVVKRIKALHPDLLLITSASYYPDDSNDKLISNARWAAGTNALLAKLHGTAAKIEVLGDISYLAKPAPECLAAHSNSVQSCSTSRKSAVTPLNAVDRVVARENHIGYINVIPWLCSRTCTPIIGNIGVYYNMFHISATYAKQLSGVLETAIR